MGQASVQKHVGEKAPHLQAKHRVVGDKGEPFDDDVTEESIIKLVESITSNTQKAVVKIYQNRQAWEEEQSGNYTDVYNQDYLVFYVKNLTDSGAYRGFNEIRWMQEKGDLQDLFGTKTKLK